MQNNPRTNFLDQAAQRKPYAPACDRNQGPILEVIQPLLKHCQDVLEIGSGTGQHAVHFAKAMPWLNWQSSDLEENHAAIHAWLNDAQLQNIQAPIIIDALASWQHIASYDAIFTANTLHIMSAAAVKQCIIKVAKHLKPQGQFLVYGPFNFNGQFSSASNAEFEQWLKARNPASGIRDFEWICEIASKQGLTFKQQYDLPANNKILHFYL